MEDGSNAWAPTPSLRPRLEVLMAPALAIVATWDVIQQMEDRRFFVSPSPSITLPLKELFKNIFKTGAASVGVLQK